MKEINLRKRRFLAVLLAFVLAFGGMIIPGQTKQVEATQYQEADVQNTSSVLAAGDTISFSGKYSEIKVTYKNLAGEVCYEDDVRTENSGNRYTYVSSYQLLDFATSGVDSDATGYTVKPVLESAGAYKYYVAQAYKEGYVAPTKYPIWVQGVQVSSTNAADVLGDGKVSFDATNQKLILNGANIGVAVVENIECGIYSEYDNLTIEVDGTNTISGDGNKIAQSYYYAMIVSEGALTLTGNGTLNDDVTPYAAYDCPEDGFIATNSLNFNGPTVNLSITGNVKCSSGVDRFNYNEDLTVNVNAGTVNVNTTSCGITPNDFNITGGKVSISGGDYGLWCDDFNITGGEIEISGNEPFTADGTATFNGGYSHFKSTSGIDATWMSGFAMSDDMMIVLPADGKVLSTEDDKLIYFVVDKDTEEVSIDSDDNAIGAASEVIIATKASQQTPVNPTDPTTPSGNDTPQGTVTVETPSNSGSSTTQTSSQATTVVAVTDGPDDNVPKPALNTPEADEEVIEDEEVALGAEDETAGVEIKSEKKDSEEKAIEDEEVPESAVEDNCIIHWIILILTIVFAAYNLVRVVVRSKSEEEEKKEQEA